ncbi:MAG: branched-chain amino acid ABC transporter permease [Actinomycetota bacterium]
MRASRGLAAGLVGGVVAVYLSVTGIIERFDGRNMVTGVIRLSHVLLLAVWLLAGYAVARRRTSDESEQPPSWPAIARATATAGVTAGLMTGLFAMGMDALFDAGINVRNVFISITPELIDLLSFGLGSLTGAVVLASGGALVAMLGGGLARLPARARRPIAGSLLAVLLLSLGEPFFRVMLAGLGQRLSLPFLQDPGWLYREGGLTPVAAVSLLVVIPTVWVIWLRRRAAIVGRIRALPAQQRQVGRIASFVLVLALLLLLPQIVGPFLSQVIGTVGLFVLLGLGLNIVVGFAGLLDLGYVAFFAVGAYVTALMTSPRSVLNDGDPGSPYWLAIPVTVVVAALVGVLIGAPVLRLRGDYLAIVTLGFGEIARVIIAADATKDWLGGPQGILGIPSPVIAGVNLGEPQFFYYLVVLFCLLAVYVSVRLQDSRVGRAWAAMREDESVAEATGISVVRYKLLAFAIGGAIGSLSGSLFAARIGSVFPSSFQLIVSITALAVIILGGMGSIRGVVVGAAVLVGLPEVLREFGEYRLLFYGAILVALMILRPEGLLPNVRRRRELHEAELPPEERFAGETPPPLEAGTS